MVSWGFRVKSSQAKVWVRSGHLFVEVVLEEVCHGDAAVAVVDAEEVAGEGFVVAFEFVVQHDGQAVFVVGADDAVVRAGRVGPDLASVS